MQANPHTRADETPDDQGTFTYATQPIQCQRGDATYRVRAVRVKHGKAIDYRPRSKLKVMNFDHKQPNKSHHNHCSMT